MLQLAVKKGSHQSHKITSFLCFSVGTQTSSIFLTTLKGYVAKLINANFKMHSFNEDHTVYCRPHATSKKEEGLFQVS